MKKMSTYYMDEKVEREMRIEAAKVGQRFPTAFFIYLWLQYQKSKKGDGANEGTL